MKSKKLLPVLVTFIFFGWFTPSKATPVSIINAGFEDITGQTVFNEFSFGLPTGWTLFDPNNITGSSGIFLGTLQPNGIDFFNTTAPEGNRVALLFGNDQFGQGEYGYTQTLSDTLQANTQYNLSVEVGNIASGTAQNGTFFNLDEFPGYRVELLAGGQVIAADDNTLAGLIPEAEFRTSNISFSTGLNNALLGQDLGVRLVNLNEIPLGFNADNSPDLEVDFDNVRLSIVTVPIPAAIWFFSFGLIGLIGIGKKINNK